MGCPAPPLLARFAADDCSPDERGAILDHAAGCAECHAAIELVLSAPAGGPGAAFPRQLGRYELGRVLGRGAMGVVHVARDPDLERDVAIKLLRPGATASRLRREAQSLARLAHPNVVRIYDVDEAQGVTFIAMELVDGQNLRQWLAEPRPLEAVLAILARAGEGLAAAHRAGLVHRDFKPDNVFIARDGQVLVGDFGLARDAADPEEAQGAVDCELATTATLTETGAVIGTPAYMAPEQLLGEATAASDQYAFCVTAWEACFGLRPVPGDSVDQLRENARVGKLLRPDGRDVPRRIERALRRGLSFDPARRFPSLAALLVELAPRPRRRWPWVVVPAALAAAGLALSWRGPAEAPRCADAAALLAPAWDDGVARRVAAHAGPPAAEALERYAAGWREARDEACRATHVRHEQSPESLERRTACLDRARDRLRLAVGALLATESSELSRPAAIVEALPPLERCDQHAPVVAPPRPEAVLAVGTLEARLVDAEVGFLGGSSRLSAAQATALRAEIEPLCYPPLLARARLLEARVLGWSGESAPAEAVLLDMIVAAEQTADDPTRALASSLLALLQARRRAPEAEASLARARAAAARAGSDTVLDLTLLEAEVAAARARGDHEAAYALQERRIARLRAAYGDGAPAIIIAFSELGTIAHDAGHPDRSQHAFRTADALTTVSVLRMFGGAFPDMALLMRSANDPLLRGDFLGSAQLARAQLAALRTFPHPALPECYVADAIGIALMLEGDYEGALAAFHESERLWNSPEEDFTRLDTAVDRVAITRGRIDVLDNLGYVLRMMGRHGEAVAVLRRCRALAIAGGSVTEVQVEECTRDLGVALVAAGELREGRELLEPVVAGLARSPARPLARARTRFALAQALWEVAGPEERPRALSLLADAEREIDLGIADAAGTPALRKLPALARGLRREIAAWKQAHDAASD